MNKIIFCIALLWAITVQAQVGINTTTPQGALDVVSSTTGMVVPRVSDIANVTTPDGNPPVDGTIVYDLSRNQICIRMAGAWLCTDVSGVSTTVTNSTPFTAIDTYIKASNTGIFVNFSIAISISADGDYLAVGAEFEDSNSVGINGDQTNNSASDSGAVYIFTRSGGVWVQQAYIKAFNTETNDNFASALSLNADGSRLVVGAVVEDSNAIGVGGDQSDNSESASGAVYSYIRLESGWLVGDYIKASNTQSFDLFGEVIALSADGSRLVIGARGEDSNAIGIGGDQTNNAASASGAVYVVE